MTNKSKSWQERFDEELCGKYNDGSFYLNDGAGILEIKSFISSILTEERTILLQELEREVEGKAPVKLMQDGASMDYSFREGWNAHLKSFVEIIKKKQNEKEWT